MTEATAERTYTTVDKSGWGDGLADEPDKVQWIDEATGLDCLIHRGPTGALCGYVGVPPGHPYYGRDYDDVDVDVHGGLTYGRPCQEGHPEGEGVCHIPEPGRPKDVWWLGFDCAHAGDARPAHNAEFLSAVGRPRSITWETYRDIDYVRAETAHLAQQLVA
jgi:hypothetical protein